MSRVRPKGVAELLVLRKEFVRYEPGEIAHIENVMKSEERNRNHRYLRQLESFTETENFEDRESIRDLETTERFELEREASTDVRTRESFKFGANLSASYGPVSVGANTEYASESSREEATRVATRQANELIDKVVERIRTKSRLLQRTRRQEETEETNAHGFNNKEGPEHISGIYRWVDKFYRHKVVSYGRRLMYEFFIPRPAAFLHFVSKNEIRAPEPPTAIDPLLGTEVPLRPDLVQPWNYMSYVGKYSVDGVRPPPPQIRTVSKAIGRLRELDPARENVNNLYFSEVDLLEVPEGYEAVQATLTGWAEPRGSRYIIIGTSDILYTFPPDFRIERTVPLSRETGRVPLSITSSASRQVSMNVEVSCYRTDRLLDEWRLSTFSAIAIAYARERQKHAEELERSRVRGIRGNNPLTNEVTIRSQLRRSILQMWLEDATPFDSAVTSGPGGTPSIEFELAARNAEIQKFLENAFEWDNVTYDLLPSQYGGHEFEVEAATMSDPDPKFEAFLKAGAARVLVPVPLEFTHHVLYFQATGMVWGGEEPPRFPSTEEGVLYNSILDDLADETGIVSLTSDVDIADDDPDAWVVKVPTSLVWLQPSMEIF